MPRGSSTGPVRPCHRLPRPGRGLWHSWLRPARPGRGLWHSWLRPARLACGLWHSWLAPGPARPRLRSLRPVRPPLTRLLVAGLAAGWVALAAGCAAARPAPAAPPSVAAAVEFGGTDLAWVELMIPMDEQALPVLDLVRARSADPRLTGLAADLRGVYDTELPRLRALSDRAGLPTGNPHKGHKMPGLVDADRLAAIEGSSGAEFDRRAVDCLREHLDQLARLATAEAGNGTSPAVRDLARQVAQNRAAASARLPSQPSAAATAGGPAPAATGG